MPLARSKQLPMMSLLHYLMLTLFHSRFLLPVPKLAHRLYNAAASSPSHPREGDSLAINVKVAGVGNTADTPNPPGLLPWESPLTKENLAPEGFEPTNSGTDLPALYRLSYEASTGAGRGNLGSKFAVSIQIKGICPEWAILSVTRRFLVQKLSY